MTSSDPGLLRSSRRSQTVLGYALLAGAIYLAWEVVKAPIVERGPPAIAVRLAPNSPEVLRRAAEAELSAARFENALELSNASLSIAPFNARALRVRGLAEARSGSPEVADEMLTLAGNWSLRDDPSHAWLVEHRLRKGDYVSAFAHADTLVRRRVDLYPSVFGLFTRATVLDARALPPLVTLMAANPPWRSAFLDHLYDDQQGAAVVASLAVALQRTEHGAFTDNERRVLYEKWLAARRFLGLRQLRLALNQPPVGRPLQDGDFQATQENYPFGWRLGTFAGTNTEIVEDDLRPNNLAVRVDYNGVGSGVFLEQLVLLDAGEYLLSGEQRSEVGQPPVPMTWLVTCAESGEVVLSRPAFVGVAPDWSKLEIRLSIPRENCSAQWLQLSATPGDRRTTIAVWLDKLDIRPAVAIVRREGSTGR